MKVFCKQVGQCKIILINKLFASTIGGHINPLITLGLFFFFLWIYKFLKDLFFPNVLLSLYFINYSLFHG